MVVVDVGIDTEHSAKDIFHILLEFLRERHIDSGGEDLLIVELVLDPPH